MDGLICKAKEAEEVLKVPDPVGSLDTTVLQASIEQLKVPILKPLPPL